ncbi:transposase [Stakelama saccharophila]|uniref:Transposase n=1 Tax=Stakelama saccharophila TaxID=3075605 RepID=A0ABZ0B957_9SPHN|nr:transposase [Stakelama sp. W311]WNO53787.1 transposase [Stakelama sp. W311]
MVRCAIARTVRRCRGSRCRCSAIKPHVSIDRRYGFIRAATVTSAAAADGRMLRYVINPNNTSSEVWADSAYRSRRNETWLADGTMTSRIHRRKPKSKPMPRANAAKSAVRAKVEHVFAHQKNRYGLFIRTICPKRAEAKMTLANFAYNFDRLIFHEKRMPTR